MIVTLSDDDILKILKIIDDAGYDSVRLEIGDLKLHIDKNADSREARSAFSTVSAPAPKPAQPVAAVVPAAPPPPLPVSAKPAVDLSAHAGMVAVRAPMLGVFYRAPSPGEKPFVEVGVRVEPADTVCLLEVMKLWNSIKAGVSGTVRQILAEDGNMVEHEQALVLIEPDAP